jgi:hypothetical protein
MIEIEPNGFSAPLPAGAESPPAPKSICMPPKGLAAPALPFCSSVIVRLSSLLRAVVLSPS